MTTLQFYGIAASYIAAARAHLESLGITTEPLDVLEPQLAAFRAGCRWGRPQRAGPGCTTLPT